MQTCGGKGVFLLIDYSSSSKKSRQELKQEHEDTNDEEMKMECWFSISS